MRQMARLLILLLPIFILVGSVSAVPPHQDLTVNEFVQFIQNTREDLELLADDIFGDDERPEEWTANVDYFTSPTIVSDLWFDNEKLADRIFGVGGRPSDWFGATSNNAFLVARNVRHDLEILADTEYGAERPNLWFGATGTVRCDRTIQNTVYLLEFGFQIAVEDSVGASTPEFCASIADEIEPQVIELTIGADEFEPELGARLLAIRGDLERLADETQGLDVRPEGYVRNIDIASPTFAIDLFADLELLADTILGLAERPSNWIGLLSIDTAITVRNMRHDVEVLADIAIEQRPRGWQGDEVPIARCEPDVQNLFYMVELTFGYEIVTPLTSTFEFCNAVETDMNTFAENPPVDLLRLRQEEGEFDDDGALIAESDFAFSYLDLSALEYMGIMPRGVEFRAWYRNFGDSNMMFVSGENFALYVDRRWTTVTEEQYTRLPTLEGVKPLTFCDARWCNGPAPTPTPTGDGPLELIQRGATPPATIAVDDIRIDQGKTQVSWNNIRTTYISQGPITAQVALEICDSAAQVTCELVNRVVDNNTGTEIAIINQFNGINVFELGYGYNNNVLVEGATLFSIDIWLSPPILQTPQPTTIPAATIDPNQTPETTSE